VRRSALAVIATADDVGRSIRGTSISEGVRGKRLAVGCMAAHPLLLSEGSKTSTVTFLFSCYCSFIVEPLLLLLEGSDILATLGFEGRVLGANVNRMIAYESVRGLRAEYVEHGVQRRRGFGGVMARWIGW